MPLNSPGGVWKSFEVAKGATRDRVGTRVHRREEEAEGAVTNMVGELASMHTATGVSAGLGGFWVQSMNVLSLYYEFQYLICYTYTFCA